MAAPLVDDDGLVWVGQRLDERAGAVERGDQLEGLGAVEQDGGTAGGQVLERHDAGHRADRAGRAGRRSRPRRWRRRCCRCWGRRGSRMPLLARVEVRRAAAAAAARCDARRSPAAADMSKTSRSTATSGATWRTIDSARPTASGAREGATTRSAWCRARSAWSVTARGRPGPRRRPTRVRPGGGGGHGCLRTGRRLGGAPARVRTWVRAALVAHPEVSGCGATDGGATRHSGRGRAPDPHRVTRSVCAVDR